MRAATVTELGKWDQMIAHNPDGGNILQTRAWGEFKRSQRWTPNYLIDEAANSSVAQLWLNRKIRSLGSIYYSPKGPGLSTTAQLGGLSDHNWERGFALKVEPELLDTEQNRRHLRDAGFRKAPDVQIHRATIILDLTGDEDVLLTGFKSKTRYNIRLAQKKGIVVEPVPCSEGNAALFFALYAETARRAGFALRPAAYYIKYWRLFEASGQGQLFLARYGAQTIAGIYVTFLGKKGWYKDGGSTATHRELMAPHLLQWEVMRWLKAKGIESYDLVAVPPADQLHESHPMYGLWRFKSGFSDEITQFVGTWDLPLHRNRYAMWRRFADPITQRINWRLHHDLFY